YASGKLGWSSRAWFWHGRPSAAPLSREALEARLRALSASSELVVACDRGTSNFCTELRDSPTSLRSFAAAWLSASRTCSLLAAVTWSRASTSPFEQLTASRPITYCVPSGAIEPAQYA